MHDVGKSASALVLFDGDKHGGLIVIVKQLFIEHHLLVSSAYLICYTDKLILESRLHTVANCVLALDLWYIFAENQEVSSHEAHIGVP